jgi:hypothetical protein
MGMWKHNEAHLYQWFDEFRRLHDDLTCILFVLLAVAIIRAGRVAVDDCCAALLHAVSQGREETPWLATFQTAHAMLTPPSAFH